MQSLWDLIWTDLLGFVREQPLPAFLLLAMWVLGSVLLLWSSREFLGWFSKSHEVLDQLVRIERRLYKLEQEVSAQKAFLTPYSTPRAEKTEPVMTQEAMHPSLEHTTRRPTMTP